MAITSTTIAAILQRMEKKLDELLERVAALEKAREGAGEPH